MKPELRQFGTLTEADFVRHPVWIGVHTYDNNEPWYDETNEETFRPWLKDTPVHPRQGIFLIRASLTLKDGTQFPGFLTPAKGIGKAKDSDLGTMQPHLFLPDGKLISFWGGLRGFDEDSMEAMYSILGREANQVFPVKFSAAPNLCKGKQAGRIKGFMKLLDLRKGKVEYSK
jgi:hypothetical protein